MMMLIKQATAFNFNRENQNFPINRTSRISYRVRRITK
jgi:hypothetical protein